MAETPAESPSVYGSVLDWAESPANTTGARIYRKIHDKSRIDYRKPKGVEQDVDTFDSLRKIGVPEVFVAVVPDGYLCGDGDSYNAVLASDRKAIYDPSLWDSGPESLDLWAAGQTDLPPPAHIPETVGVMTARPSWSYPYFHWMLQVLPRFHLLQASGITIDKYAINARKRPFQYETLTTLGLDEASLIEVDTRFHISARQLAVPSIVSGWIPAWACSFLRERFLDATSVSGECRLYISRATASRGRNVVNEDQVKETLAKFGFREFLPDQVSVAEQAETFASASIILGPHGSALTNLVFCQPGAKVVELFAPAYVHPVYWMLSSQCDLDYYYLVGKGERPPTWSTWPPHPALGRGVAPIEVDLDQLTEVLTMAGL
jgi:hypothetical protein